MDLDPHSLFALASGVTLHNLIYRVGEWDTTSLSLLLSHILVLTAGSVSLGLLRSYTEIEVTIAPYGFCRLCFYHLVGVYSSMLVYRAFFHRLRKFPGPFLARLSTFYLTSLSSDLHLNWEVEKLHKQYGDYLRLGPTELSISDPDAVQAIYGSQSKVRKGPWYRLLDPRICLSFAPTLEEHNRRRRVWDRGFSTKAMREYEPLVANYAQQLVEAVENNVGKEMNMTQWFTYFAFDVMGNLAFGKSFNMIADGKEAYFLKTIRGDMKDIGRLKHQPWIFPIFTKTPILNSNNLKFWKWLENAFTERIARDPDPKDIFSWILAEYRKGARTPQDTLNLHGDGYLIVVAGSDTVAVTMTFLFLHIASDKALAQKLQKEIDALTELNDDALSKIDLIDAAIYETLRLHPAVPSGLQRVTPSEGMWVGEKYLPGNTIVQVPMHTVFRDPRVFDRPDEFIVERWTESPELVKDGSAFIPFNIGPYACIGKRLALMELRRVTAELLRSYDISLAPGQTQEAFLNDSVDTFTCTPATLMLNFTKRA
ncbi:hypothetical protein FQN54_007328 [Arachnomyces sp. PD_36]|nr:hypothetical protein FQN54_007328 [Arachnomyces sp. PD_36]